MSRRLAAVAAALLAALGAVGAAGAEAATPDARPATGGYSLAQVQALADASPSFTVSSAPVRSSPAQAYAAAAAPGAIVEGSQLAATATTALCWAGTYTEQWGVWPLYQRVISHDTWCSTNWSHLYYHSNYVTTEQVFCSASAPFHSRVAGGVSGQMTDEWNVGARFSCPTSVPGLYYNPTRSFDIVVAADGGYYHG